MMEKTNVISITTNSNSPYVPVWEKYALTVEEAAEYFGIGKGRIRTLAANNPDSDFLLHIGSHIKIKRKEFEQFMKNIHEL